MVKQYGTIDLYRCRMTLQIGKNAIDGKGVPKGIRSEDWIAYQLFSAIEDIAIHLLKEANK